MVILDRELLTTIRSVKPSPSRSAARNSPIKLSMGYVSGPLKPKLFVVSELLARPRLVMPSHTQAITAAVLRAVEKVVAQVSKPAVSRVSKPANASRGGVRSILLHLADLEVGDTAGLETCATIVVSKCRLLL